jgi:hypothetical protein
MNPDDAARAAVIGWIGVALGLGVFFALVFFSEAVLP